MTTAREYDSIRSTADNDGDFVQDILTAGQYEVIRAHVQE